MAENAVPWEDRADHPRPRAGGRAVPLRAARPRAERPGAVVGPVVAEEHRVLLGRAGSSAGARTQPPRRHYVAGGAVSGARVPAQGALPAPPGPPAATFPAPPARSVGRLGNAGENEVNRHSFTQISFLKMTDIALGTAFCDRRLQAKYITLISLQTFLPRSGSRVADGRPGAAASVPSGEQRPPGREGMRGPGAAVGSEHPPPAAAACQQFPVSSSPEGRLDAAVAAGARVAVLDAGDDHRHDHVGGRRCHRGVDGGHGYHDHGCHHNRGGDDGGVQCAHCHECAADGCGLEQHCAVQHKHHQLLYQSKYTLSMPCPCFWRSVFLLILRTYNILYPLTECGE